MAKSNAAQNQTVDEILASIRQAISDDGAKQPTASAPTKDRGAEDPSRADNVSNSIAHDGDAGQPDTIVDDPQMQEVIDLAIEKALDGVRAELDADPDAGKDAPEVAAGQVVEKPDSDPAVAQPRLDRHTRPRSDEPRAQRPLLSPRAGAAVSASFDDLAGSLTPGHPGKVDKVVEGILRPMLRSWLDDNLPTLVERLVREEIDRVSRGRR